MRSSVPDGDLTAIIEEAVTEKLERLEAKRFAKTKSPRKSVEQVDTAQKSRHIPAPVKRAVRERDGDQCAFVDARGRRCKAHEGLELHHKQPYARGGDHSPENLQLVCRTHNGYFAERDYGKEFVARYRCLARSRLATTFNDGRTRNRVSEPAPTYYIGSRVALMRPDRPATLP